MTPLRLPRPSVSLAVKIAATTSLPILAVLVTALLAVNSRVAAQQNRTVTADLARAWETQILPARAASYDPADLEGLCLAGSVVWGRLRTDPPCATSLTAPSN